MSFTTGYLLGMASGGGSRRGGGGSFDFSSLTFKDVANGLSIGFVMFFVIYMLALDSLKIKANKDIYGQTYSRNVAVLSNGMSAQIEVGLRSAYVARHNSGISISTKHDGIVYFDNEIRGEEYDNLIKYLSEGCNISYSYYGTPISIYGWMFRLYFWRLKTIGF